MNFDQFFEQAEHRWSGRQGGLSGGEQLFTELEFFTTDRDSQGRIFIDEHMLRVRQMLKESQLGRR